MNITGMLIQMQRPTLYLNGQQKHEGNIETDIDNSGFVRLTMLYYK